MIDPEKGLPPALLKRCRDLRRLAERAGTPAEARAAAMALAKTMRRHRIEEAQLSLEQEELPAAAEYVVRNAHAAGRVVRWRRCLLTLCADMHAVVSVLQKADVDGRTAAELGLPADARSPLIRRVQIYTFVGPSDDVHRALAMYIWLAEDIERAGRDTPGVRYPDDYRFGFVSGLNDQYEEMRQQEHEVSERALMVLTDQKAAIVDHLATEGIGKAAKPRPLNIDHRDLEAGRRAGRGFPLAGNVLAPSQEQDGPPTQASLPLETS